MVIIQLNREQLNELIKNSVYEALKDSRKKEAKPQQTEQLLNIKEAAAFLSLKVPTLYGLVSKNSIPYMKVSKRLYFSSKDLMNYLKEGRKMSSDEIEQDVEKYLSKNKKG